MEQGIAAETFALVENRRQRQRKAQQQLQARLEELQAENARRRSFASAVNSDIGGTSVWQPEQDHTHAVHFDISDADERQTVAKSAIEDLSERIYHLEFALFNAPVMTPVRIQQDDLQNHLGRIL